MKESVGTLIACLRQNIGFGFSQEKPVAAITIYKCLVHWKSFEAEKTSVFDRLINMIGSEIEVTKRNVNACTIIYSPIYIYIDACACSMRRAMSTCLIGCQLRHRYCFYFIEVLKKTMAQFHIPNRHLRCLCLDE